MKKEGFKNVKEAYNQLQDAMQMIRKNDGWLEYLAFQAKFYNYT